MRLLRLLLLAFPISLLPACGAAGDDSSDGNPPNGDNSDYGDDGGGADQPAYEPDPPPGTAIFYANHASGDSDIPPGNLAKGFASAFTTTGLMTELAETGSAGGLLRRNLKLHAPHSSVPTSLLKGEEIGMESWLTVMGTPLELSPSIDGEEFDTGLPPYARWTPMDVEQWADTVVTNIEQYENTHGFVPSYVEIWNEPDRIEYYSDDIHDYLTIYQAASVKVKNRWPSIKVGGMGLAGFSSTMGGSESAILTLIDFAADNDLPLDFVSWHHYTIANELLYSGFVDDIKQRLASRDRNNVMLVISEWNIFPSANTHGPEFDGAHSAANYAGFQTTARELGLDGNIMFLLQDSSPAANVIDDFAGKGMGAITTHGIKKPVFHVIETLQQMADEQQITTIRPKDELSVNVYATKVGNRIRYVVSNDIVTGDWVWANRLRDAGLLPGYLWPLYFRAANIGRKHRPTDDDLLTVGMTNDEIIAINAIEDELNMSWRYATESRPVEIIFGGQAQPNISNVYRFDSQHNNFAASVDVIMPLIEQTEDNAKWHALTEAADFLFDNGIVVNPNELSQYEDLQQWAEENDVPYSIARSSIFVYQKAVAEGRMFDQHLLNSLPQMAATAMTAEDAEVTAASGSMHFFMEPNSVVIFDVNI